MILYWLDLVGRFFNFKDVSSWSKELLYDSDDDFNMYDWEFIFQLGLLGIILVFRVKKIIMKISFNGNEYEKYLIKIVSKKGRINFFRLILIAI